MASLEYSQTLQHITDAKLEELSIKRQIFLDRKVSALKTSESLDSLIAKIRALSNGVKSCFNITIQDGRVVIGSTNHRQLEIDLANLDRFLKQAEYDPAVSPDMTERWHQSLLRYLEIQTIKYEYATLFAQLTMEWLSVKKKRSSQPPATSDFDFEKIASKAKTESRQAWEKVVFTPAGHDAETITAFLTELFSGIGPLDRRKRQIKQKALSLGQITSGTLDWVINGLLNSDLVIDKQRAALRSFQKDENVLTELSDVLNMRLAGLHAWTWGPAVHVEQKRQMNGDYQIRMHEDLIQAIFLQYLGVRWSVFLKSALHDFRKTRHHWKTLRSQVPAEDKKRREFFLGKCSDKPSAQIFKESIHRRAYFVSELLDSEFQIRKQEEGEEEDSSWDATYDDIWGANVKSPVNQSPAKQNLLLLLSADTIISKRLHGDITCFRAQYESLYPSLPHTTILAVLRFLGMSEKWLSFFQKFLAAPLKFMDEPDAEPRTRKRGTPGSHVLSELFGETTLFCLDLMINQECDGELLWRVNDDMWFWSHDQETCVTAWKVIQSFNGTMGISISADTSGGAHITAEKTDQQSTLHPVLPNGKIRWGMLYLNAESGNFEIDQEIVDEHIKELQRQLDDKQGSIFGWIQAWNSYASTFFTYNFGIPANCFGQRHVGMMLETHERIQRKIFCSGPEGGKGNSSVLTYLRDTIQSRFGTENLPDGYFFLPIDLGGLELSSPFINLVALRDSILSNPDSLLDDFFEAEKSADAILKRQYQEKDKDRLASQRRYRPEDADHFMSFEEYARHRESLDYGFQHQLVWVYDQLLKRPQQEEIRQDVSGPVTLGLSQLQNQFNLSGIRSDWRMMSSYWKWLAQLYGPEIVDRFGGFNIVDPGLLPIGLVSQFRSGRVSWTEE
ncbi:hypothetical protein N7488_004642 [Penicillium malachiteum]|nr:hypothetical protein N7488_004642 [Penicillium malachiteum]